MFVKRAPAASSLRLSDSHPAQDRARELLVTLELVVLTNYYVLKGWPR